MTIMKFGKKTILCFILILIFFLPATHAYSGTTVKLRVRTILASHTHGPSDPRLKDLTHQLQSVFNYDSYKLLKQNHIILNQRPSSRVSLPGNRVMSITSTGISGNRATLQIEIFKNKRRIFQTVIRLRRADRYPGGDTTTVICPRLPDR